MQTATKNYVDTASVTRAWSGFGFVTAPTPANLAAAASGNNYSLIMATPTGASLALSLADWLSQQINVAGYVDLTGATGGAAGMALAASAACASTPPKALYIPRGVVNLDANFSFPCNNLQITGPIGGYTLKVNAANTSTNSIALDIVRRDGIRITGANIDVSAQTVSTGPAIRVVAPAAGFTLDGVNLSGGATNSAIYLGAPGPVNTVVATASGPASANPNQVVLNSVTGLHAGACPVATAIPHDECITSVNPGTNTITLRKPLPVTLEAGATPQWTGGATLTADAYTGQNTLKVDAYSQFALNNGVYGWHQAVWIPDSQCIQTGSWITAFNTSTLTLTLSKKLTCKIPSGTSFAFGSGYPGLTIVNSSVDNFGQGNRNAGSMSYALALSTNIAADAYHLTFSCLSTGCANKIGLTPGDIAGASAQGGLPANDPILDRTLDTANSRFTVLLQNPLTADIAAGTSLTWQVSKAGGFGLWNGYGAFFANTGWRMSNDTFSHTYSSPLFLANLSGPVLQNVTISEDFQEYTNATVAPSACIYLVGQVVNPTLNNVNCSGATGSGLETDYAEGVTVNGGSFNNNGVFGIFIGGGTGWKIIGTQAKNNNQEAVIPVPYVFLPYGYGVAVNTSAGYSGSQGAKLGSVQITNLDGSDDQAAPTQTAAVGSYNPGLSYSTITMSNISGAGTTTGLGAMPSVANLGSGIAAGGASLATATQIPNKTNIITACTSGAVALNDSTLIGDTQTVINECGSALTVYPGSSSDTINTGAAGAPVVVPSGTAGAPSIGQFFRTSQNGWTK